MTSPLRTTFKAGHKKRETDGRKKSSVSFVPPLRKKLSRSIAVNDQAFRSHVTVSGRGLYRVFNDAEYRFFRKLGSPPTSADAAFDTNATLPHTPVDTYGAGVWYLGVKFFNGVMESGFLPVGPNGEPYLRLELSGGSELSNPPKNPDDVRLVLRPGGVVRVIAFYSELSALRGTEWALAYTTNGVDPVEDTPTITKSIPAQGVGLFEQDLPAQVNGTTVKVRLQTRRGTIYSDASTVQVATADALGPTAVIDSELWDGRIPEDI